MAPAGLVMAAQYATACAVPCVFGPILACIPFVGQIAWIAIPAGNGWLVNLVGDKLGGRDTQPWAPIVGAFIGQLCIMPTCTLSGVAVFFAAYFGGLAGILGGGAAGRPTNPASLGFWLGLSAAGYAALVGAVLCGQGLSAAVPVAAYQMFNVDADADAAETAEELAPDGATTPDDATTPATGGDTSTPVSAPLNPAPLGLAY